MWKPATREARSQSRSRRVTCFFIGQKAANGRFNERFGLLATDENRLCQ
jgi:hypothetical protein